MVLVQHVGFNIFLNAFYYPAYLFAIVEKNKCWYSFYSVLKATAVMRMLTPVDSDEGNLIGRYLRPFYSFIKSGQ